MDVIFNSTFFWENRLPWKYIFLSLELDRSCMNKFVKMNLTWKYCLEACINPSQYSRSSTYHSS